MKSTHSGHFSSEKTKSEELFSRLMTCSTVQMHSLDFYLFHWTHSSFTVNKYHVVEKKTGYTACSPNMFHIVISVFLCFITLDFKYVCHLA